MFGEIYVLFNESTKQKNHYTFQCEIEKLNNEFKTKLTKELFYKYLNLMDEYKCYHIVRELEIIKFTINYLKVRNKR